MTESIRYDEAGFRIRAEQPTRVEGFVDAAFAFAVTLLVVSVGRVPESVPELLQAMRGVPAFLASFLLIARFWHAHRQWSRRYGIEDNASVRLSLALVFVILVYVYPLRMVADMAFAGFSGNVLSEHGLVLGSMADLRALYVTFAIGYGIVSGILLLLYRHALRSADALALSPVERLRTRTISARHLLSLAVAALSLLLALAAPTMPASPLTYSLPGLCYWLIVPFAFALRRRERAASAALPADAPA